MQDDLRAQLNELRSRAPFFPFTLTVTSGEVIEVSDPELMAVGPRTLTYYARDCWHLLPLIHISNIKVKDPVG